MKPFKAASAASLLFVAIGVTAAPADSYLQPVHVDMMETCKQGLVIWLPRGKEPKCGQVQTPQVKVFDSAGRLKFVGTGMDALQWAKSGMPSSPIPNDVVVRDAASEARITQVPAPSPGRGWVTYYTTKPCPPCERQLATFRTDVMPKLGVGTGLSVFDLW